MADVCYLCGKALQPGQARSDDHVVPATLIARTQPKVRDFDYGSHLPTHETCNNRFGDETYVSKGLDLLRVLHGPRIGGPLQHKHYPSISILPLDASLLSHFTARDLKFFKIYDARQCDVASFSDPDFYAGKVKVNPVRHALRTSLSVLAKSAAALLVKRYMKAIPTVWRIYSNAYAGDLSGLDFSEFLGEHKPFDAELRIWVVELPEQNWHVIYAAKGTLIFFTFAFNGRTRVLRHLDTAHGDADTLKFVGTSINELMTSGWRLIRSPD
jgi:hypothetical protein